MRVNDEADSFINSVQYHCTGTAGDVCPTELPFFSTNAEFLRGGTDIGEVLRDIGKTIGRPDLQKQGETLLQEMVYTNSRLRTSTVAAPEPRLCVCAFFALDTTHRPS